MTIAPFDLAIVALIALGALAGSVRAWRHVARWRAWLVVLNLAAAALLVAALYPPVRAGDPDTLVVVTGGASDVQRASLPPRARIVLLPEAPDVPGARRVADLASALRPEATPPRLRIVGAGLGVRDRDAARGLALRFDAAPAVRGIVALDHPQRVASGQRFDVAARVSAPLAARAELRDPAGAVVATSRVSRDGRVTLGASARAPGAVLFSLRVLDDKDAVVDTIAVPIAVDAQAPPRVLFIAGAPSPELKYLRRWARDAGVEAGARITLGPGMTIDRDPPRLDAGTLAQHDLVVVDERSWRALSSGERAVVLDSVRGGLGLLLRLTTEPDDALRRELAAWRLPLRSVEMARTVTLRGELGALPREIALWRLPLRADGADAVPLLRADDAISPGAWITHGRGRIGALWLTDSYRLVLEGHADRFGTLWSRVVARVGRARGEAPLALPIAAWRGERFAICGVADAGDGTEATITDPGGKTQPLRVDPATGASRCAAYWPALAGWHALRDGDRRQDVFVRAPDDAKALRHAQLAAATRALQADAPVITAADRASAVPDVPTDPATRWPWFIAWLATIALAWASERRARR